MRRIRAKYITHDKHGREIPREARFYFVEPSDYRKLLAVVRASERFINGLMPDQVVSQNRDRLQASIDKLNAPLSTEKPK